jgi:hypothetical protein
MKSIKMNLIAFDVSGHEKGESLNVIPMKMRDKDVETKMFRIFQTHDIVAKISQPGASVENDKVPQSHIPNFHTRGVGAITSSDGKREMVLHEK